MTLNATVIIVSLLCGSFLFLEKVRNNRTWRATVTPLASIIGSGFLVIVPLLGHTVGGYAPIAMTGIVVVAYLVGSAIGFNIRYAEPLLEKPNPKAVAVLRFDYASDITLGFAYFISVTFYLRLLSSFALRGIGGGDELTAKIMTSVILLFIGMAGWIRGLSLLERLEEYSVSIKLAIISSLIVAWSVYDISGLSTFDITPLLPAKLDGWYVARLLAGLLIVVQGFETSRYLGQEYSAKTRIDTMRRAQILSGIIYILFVTLTVPGFAFLGEQINETAIIDLSRVVASVLPHLLILAAMMSQFSAAVADTVGAGGLFAETIGKRLDLPAKAGYLLVAVVGVFLVWTANIFEIISMASRAFAFYYALQSLVALFTAKVVLTGYRRAVVMGLFGLLALCLLIGSIVAIPAD